MHSQRHLYVRWAGGFEGLYDFEDDPYETRNRAGDVGHRNLLQSLRVKTLAGVVPTPPGFTYGR